MASEAVVAVRCFVIRPLWRNQHLGIAQHIKQRLLSISREWFLDLSLGLPWFDTILGKHRSLNLVEALIRGQIDATPNVVRLAAFNLEAVENVERTVRVTFHAVLEYGSDLSSEIII